MQQKKYVHHIMPNYNVAMNAKLDRIAILDHLNDDLVLTISTWTLLAMNLIGSIVGISPILPGRSTVLKGKAKQVGIDLFQKTIKRLEGYFDNRSVGRESLLSTLSVMQYSLRTMMLIGDNLDVRKRGNRPIVIILPNIFGLTSWHYNLSKTFVSLGSEVILVEYFKTLEKPNPLNLLRGKDPRKNIMKVIEKVDEQYILQEIIDLIGSSADDNRKIYVLGSSYGAKLAMALASSGDKRIRLMCLYYPILFYKDGFTLIGNAEPIDAAFRNIITPTSIFIGESDDTLHPLTPQVFSSVSARYSNIKPYIFYRIGHAFLEPFLFKRLPSALYQPWLSWLTIMYFILFMYDDLVGGKGSQPVKALL